MVDLDSTLRLGRHRRIYEYDQAQGGLLGTNSSGLMALGRLVFSETSVTSLTNVNSPEDVSVDLSLAQAARSGGNPFQGLRIPSFETGTVEGLRNIEARASD